MGWWGEGSNRLVARLNAVAPPGATYASGLACALDAVPVRPDLREEPVGKARYYLFNYPSERDPPAGYRARDAITAGGAVIGALMEKDPP